MLLAPYLQTALVRDGDSVKTVPANLASYHLGANGKLTFADNYEVGTGNSQQFWNGMVALGSGIARGRHKQQFARAVGKHAATCYRFGMIATDLKDLLERIQAWPETAQDELIAVANQIESELRGGDYLATMQELQAIDSAIASIDGGESATDAEVAAVFAKFGSA